MHTLKWSINITADLRLFVIYMPLDPSFLLWFCEVPTPSCSPYLDEKALGKPLAPKPMAVKAGAPYPKKTDVQAVAKPLNGLDVVPFVAPAGPALSPRQPPQNRALETTVDRINRIVAPSKAPPSKKGPGVARELSQEFDAVSESQEPVHSQSSLVFPKGCPVPPPPDSLTLMSPATTMPVTPSMAPTTPLHIPEAKAGNKNALPILSQTQLCNSNGTVIPIHFFWSSQCDLGEWGSQVPSIDGSSWATARANCSAYKE